jgi:hypothetical protein
MCYISYVGLYVHESYMTSEKKEIKIITWYGPVVMKRSSDVAGHACFHYVEV